MQPPTPPRPRQRRLQAESPFSLPTQSLGAARHLTCHAAVWLLLLLLRCCRLATSHCRMCRSV